MSIKAFASFPSSRREGPSNVATNIPRVTLATVGDTTILTTDQARASFIIRNESLDTTARIYFDTSDFNSGMTLRPGESKTLQNVKNEVLGRSVGPATVEVSITETRT